MLSTMALPIILLEMSSLNTKRGMGMLLKVVEDEDYFNFKSNY